MSTIDERVVEMRFDNEQFQKGIEESIESLDNLKESLDMDEATKSLEKLEKTGGDFSLDGVVKSIDEVQNKFNVLEAVAFGAFANIGAQAANAGLKIAKAFTVDQIFSGKGKYELKTQSVQAIKAALPDTELSEIMDQLADLNKYTDETSYDFAQMVATIGKFTANGVKLKDAVEAMKGIGNEAAKSGANIGEANRAMYNFAQALSSGTVKYIDWKSIELANMGTKEFKQTIIDTAVELKQLKKVGDKIKTKKGTLVDFKTFATTLNEGWFTSEVLVKTLNKYADVTTDFGLDAFHAAQQALSFTQAMQAIADAASTGWAHTFELLFGDLDEAIDFFTGFCNQIIEVINNFDASRNNLIKAWRGQDILDDEGGIAEEIDNEIDGRTKLIEGLNDALWGLTAVAESVKSAFADIFPSSINDKANTLIDLTTTFADAMHKFRVMLVNDTVVNNLAEDDELILGDLLGMSKDTHFVSKKGEKPDEERRKITEVRRLAMQLKSLGYLGEEADKILLDVEEHGFSDTLSEKLKEFQKDVGYTESGIYDLNTAILLTQKLMAKSEEIKFDEDDIVPFLGLKKGDKNKDDITALQDQLTKLGYELGSSDGIFGKKTEAAVKKFQKDMGLAETGILDVKTATELYKKTLKKDGGIEAEFDYYGGTDTFDKLKRVFRPLAASVKVILSGMKAIIKTGAGVAGSILKAFGPVLDVLAVIGDGVTSALTWFADSGILDFISDWFLSSAGFTADLVRYGAEAIKWIFGFGGAAKSEDGKIHNFAQLIGYVVEKVKEFDIFGKISGHLNSFKEKLANTTGKLSEWFATFKENMDEKWQERFDKIVAGIDEFFSVFSSDKATKASENGEKTTTWVTTFATAIQTALGWIDTEGRHIATAWDEFLTALSGNSDRLQYKTGDEPWYVKLGNSIRSLFGWIGSESTKIRAKWSLFLYALRGDTRASEKSPWYVKLGTQIYDLFGWIGDRADDIKSKWNEFLSSFSGETEVSEDSPWWVKLGEKVQALWTWIEEKRDTAITAWNDFLSSFRGETEVSEDSPWWVKLGEKVQILWTWIEEKVDTVKKAWGEFIGTFSSDDDKPEDYQPWWVTVGYAFQDAWGWILEKVTAVKEAIAEIKKSIFGENGGEIETAEYYKALEKNKMYTESGTFIGAIDPKTGETLTPEQYKEKMRPYAIEQYNNDFGQLSFMTTSFEMLNDTFENSTEGEEKRPWWWTLLENIIKFSASIGKALDNIGIAWREFLSALRGETEVNENSPWWVKLAVKIKPLFDWIGSESKKIGAKWSMFLYALKGEIIAGEKAPWYIKLGTKIHDFFDNMDKKLESFRIAFNDFLIALSGNADRLQYRTGEEPWYIKLGIKMHHFFDKISKKLEPFRRAFSEFLIALSGNADRLQYRTGEEPWYIKLGIKMYNFFDKISKKLEPIKEAWQEFLSAFRGDSEVNEDSPWWVKLGSKLGDFFADIDNRLEPVRKIWKNVKGTFSDIIKVLFGKDGAEQASERLQKKFGAIYKVVEAIKKLFGSIGKIMGNSLGKIFPFLKSFNAETTGFIGVFTAILGGFAIGKAVSIVNDISNFLQLFKGNVLNTVTNMKFQFRPFSLMFLEMSASIFLIGLTMKMIGEMDNVSLGRAGFVIGIIFGIIGFISNNVLKLASAGSSLYEKTLRSYARLVTEIAFSILIISASVYILGTMNTADLIKGVLAVGAIAITISIVMRNIGKVGNGVVSYKNILSMVASIGLVALLVIALSKLDLAVAIKGVGMFMMFAGVLTLAVKMLSKGVSQIKGKELAGVWKMVILLGTMSILVYILGKMDFGKAIQGLAILTLLALDIKLLMWSISGIKNDKVINSTKAMTGILALALAMAVLAITVSYLGTLSTAQLEKGLFAMGVITGALAVLLRSVAKINLTSGKQIFGIAVVLAGVIIAIKVFADALKDAQNLDLEKTAAFVLGFAVFIGSVIAMMYAASTIKIEITGFVAAVAIIGVALISLYALTEILKNFNGVSTRSMEQFIKIVDCFTTIVWTMAGISALFSFLGSNVWIGILAAIVLVIGIVATIVGVIAFLSIEKVKKTLMCGMKNLGEILGSAFVGFAVQMEKAQKIIDRANIDIKVFAGMVELATAFASLTLMLPTNSTVGNLTGVSSFKTFSEGIPTFVQSCINAYNSLYSTNDKGKTIANINISQFTKDIKNLTAAADAIADISVPRTSIIEGILYSWGGIDYTGFTQFCNNLPKFIEGCIAAYDAMYTTDENGKTISSIKNIKEFKTNFLLLADVAKAFSEVESSFPDCGFIESIGQKWAFDISDGQSDGFVRFCMNLPMFIEACGNAYTALYGEESSFSEKLKGKTFKDFGTDMNTLITMAQSLATVETTVPDLSFFSLFTAALFNVDTTGFETFCDDIPALVKAFDKAYDKLYEEGSFDSTSIEGKKAKHSFKDFTKDYGTILELATSFSGIEGSIPDTSALTILTTGWAGGLTYDGFDRFCNDIPQLVDAFNKAYKALYEGETTIGSIKGKSIDKFKQDFGKLISLAESFSSVHENIPDQEKMGILDILWGGIKSTDGFDRFCNDIPQLVTAFGTAYKALYDEKSTFQQYENVDIAQFTKDFGSIVSVASSFSGITTDMPDYGVFEAWSKSWGGKDEYGNDRTDKFAQFCTHIGTFIRSMGSAYTALYSDVETYGPPEPGLKVKTERNYGQFSTDMGTIVTIAEKLRDFMTSIGEIEDIAQRYGLWGQITNGGETSQLGSFFGYVGRFGDEMSSLQTKLNGFSEGTILDDTETAIETVDALKEMILDLAKPDDDGYSVANNSDGFNKIADNLTTFGNAMDGFDVFYSAGVDKFTAAVDAYKTLAELSGRDINVETLSSDLGGLNEAVTSTSDQVGESLEEGMSGIDVSWGSTIVEKLIKSMDGHSRETELIGKNLTIGLKNGLTESVSTSALYQTGRNIVTKLVDEMKEAADEHSPSKKTAWIGKYLDLGLVKGLDKYSGLVSKTAGGISDDAIDAIRGSMTGVSNLIDSDISLDPVIRPVVDMSNVTRSSNTIDSMLGANRTVKLNTSRVASTFGRTAGIQNGSGAMSNSFANDSSVNITGNQFVIRNDNDIRSLAHEIASYTNQQQRNLGLAIR